MRKYTDCDIGFFKQWLAGVFYNHYEIPVTLTLADFVICNSLVSLVAR